MKVLRSQRWRIDGLKDLVKYLGLNENSQMVEVGCYAGESTEIFAVSGAEIQAVDTWAPPFVEPDAEQKFDELVSRYPNIRKRKMRGTEAAKLFEDFSMDFVYIDAWHDYESVLKDINEWRPKVKRGCIIGGHDYTRIHSGVIEAVKARFGKPEMIFEDTSWIVHC